LEEEEGDGMEEGIIPAGNLGVEDPFTRLP
jgi:hypothetical protein